MSVTQRILFTLSLLAWIMTYLTYSPSDSRYFWTYWVSFFFALMLGRTMSAESGRVT